MEITVMSNDVQIKAELWEHFERVAAKAPVSNPDTYLGVIINIIEHGIKKLLGFDHNVNINEIKELMNGFCQPVAYVKMPFHWFSWVIENYTIYHYLMIHHPQKKILEEALEATGWRQAIMNPQYQELVRFVHNLLFCQPNLFPKHIDRLKYITPDSDAKIINYYKQLGIHRRDFVRQAMPETKLPVSMIVPHFVWDEAGLMFGGPNTKVLGNRHYCNNDLDIAIWLCGYKKWMHSVTYYMYKNVPVRIHHHNLIKFLELPQKKGKFNLSIHPKDWLKENKQEQIDELVVKTYNYIHTEFQKNDVIEKVLATWDGIRILRTAKDLMQESKEMQHCIDSLDYVELAMEGKAFFFHFEVREEKGASLGLYFNEKHDEFDIIQFCGYKNEHPPVQLGAIMGDFVQEINQTYWRK